VLYDDKNKKIQIYGIKLEKQESCSGCFLDKE